MSRLGRPTPPPVATGVRQYHHMGSVDARPDEFADGYRRGWGPWLRDDLALRAVARALGYAVSHRGGSWENAATFDAPGVAVWYAGDGWQARDLGPDGHSGPRRVYGDRGPSLLVALLREAPPLLTHASSGGASPT